MAMLNFGVLTDGFDAPAIRSARYRRNVRPNQLVLYSQMAGRALRGPLAWWQSTFLSLYGRGRQVQLHPNLWQKPLAIPSALYVVNGQQLELFDPVINVKAIRDSRYKTSAFAIAELVDNSIDWEALDTPHHCSKRTVLWPSILEVHSTDHLNRGCR